MTKRILAVLMALVMILGLLPLAVIAQDISHADETHSCGHCETVVTWTAWDGAAALVSGGHYVLTADVTLATPVSLSEGSYVLCLGGYTLRCATTAFQLSGTASLTVTDCTARTEEEVYTAGVITGATTSAIRVADDAVFTMCGGIMSDNTNTSTSSTEGGGAVNASGKAQVNLLGGVLSGNTSGKYGGAVFARNNAQVTMENMTVTGNSSQVGGAIYGTGAVAFSMKDTTVTGNTGTHTSTTNAGYAAAVYMSGSALTFTVSGKVVIADNTVTSGNVKVPDLELGHEGCDTLLVNELAEGSNIVFGTYKTAVTGSDLSSVIAVSSTQTDWNSHWVTYKYGNGNTELVGRNAEGVFSTGHYHDGQLYTPITNNVDMKNAAGYCYLTTDLSLGGEQTRNKDLHLCLNGHTIKAKAGKRIFTTSDKTPAVFTIEDCTAYTDENGVYHAGKLTGGQNTVTGGGAIYLAAGNTLNLQGGIICGNTSSVIGGAILAYGTVNISGGEISGNSAIAEDGAYKNGGAIALNAGSKLTMTGGTIKDNVSKGGGAIYAGKTTLEISGGTITGNEAKENGGAIFSTGTGDLTVSGGEIIGNTAGILGGGIYCQTGMSLSGEPVIKDNTGGNLYLVDEALLTVGEMGANANVGISAAVAPRAISETLEQDHSGRFFSDNRHYQVLYRDNVLYLEVFSDHPHCVEGCLDACDHEKLQYIPWEQADSLPVSGCYYLATDVVLTQETVLSGDLQLCLNGHTVTAAEGKRILSTTANADIQIILSDCTAAETDGVYTAGKLTGGRDLSTAGGGAMYLRAGTTLTMYDGILTDNQSVAAGGAIAAATGAKVELHGGQIAGNKAIDAEGKTKNGGGIFLNVDAEMIMDGGEVSRNEGAYGGGIYVNKAKLTLSDGVIAHNQATTGGGIQVSADGQLTIEGGVIDGNSVTTNGGGIYAATGSTFTMTGGTVKNNTSSSNGGGIYLLKLTTAFEGGEVTGNSAVTGGGLYFNGTTVTINKLTVSGNKAEVGGGIYGKSVTSKNEETGEDEDFPVSVKLSAGTVVKNNNASKNGGGICITGKNAMLDMPAGTITGNYGKNAGGILLMGKSTMKLSGGSVSGNSANSGGGLYVSTGCKLNMVGGSVSGNRTTKNGGGIYMLRSTATFSGGVISGNQGEAGGGLYVSGGKATLQGTTFTGNCATKNGGAVMSTVSSVTKNGVKDVAYSTVTVTAGLITKNTAINAGGLLVQSRGCELNIQGGKITENTATSSGGGIYVSTNGTLNMSGGEVSNNIAKASGGIHHNKSIGNYTGGTVTGNKAATGGGMIVGGGETCSVVIEKLTVSNNSADRAGGGILVQGKANLHVGGAEIVDNTSGKIGGGICISSQTHITMNGTQLANNTANTEGGGVYVYTASSAVMDNVTMTGNHAVKTGGGIFSRGRLILTNSYIQLNTCDGDGGGIGTYRVGINRIGKNSYMTVENTVVSGNTCGGKGGGVYLSIGHPAELKNMRITGNTSGAEGGGIWSGCHLSMDSLTVTDNQSGGEGYAVYLTESRYDGQSFVGGVLKMQGDTVIRDNNGGDMFLGEDATISIPGGVLGENAYVHINLASGLLTNQVLGSYDYEGGNQDYIITAGSRSMTEPEIAPTEEAPTEEPTEAPTGEDHGNSGTGALVVGIAGVCLVVVAAAIIIVLMAKKKKTAQK